ncbi:hypothetical protein VE04_07630 [Pseudogymnoascus sp. 24MN13]|nr:hypothetical protein VE04_07630 [Pseudogymnoascus sp. 24MN13]
MSVGTITTDASDWDTTNALNGLFHDGGGAAGSGYLNSPFSHPAPAPPFGGAYAALNSKNSAPNAATRGFETHPPQQQFSTQVLSYNTSKFIPRPRPPPPPLSSLSEGFQVQQQANEYWNSLAASTNQENNWKMNYNDNPILADFTRQCAYDEFIPLPMQTGGRLSSFSLGEDGQSPDTLHFSPNDDGGQDYGEKRWGDTLKCHGQNLPSHHGLPYTFFDDSSNANASAAGAFPPWTDTPGLDTISPKALTLSSSSISFSGSSSSDCGSLDSVSTHDGPFHSTSEIQSIQEVLKQEANQEVTVRHKLPTRPLRQ